MKLDMQFKEYLDILISHSNEPLTLNMLTLPFGILSNSEESNSLMVGHILEILAERMENGQVVDCVDVVAAAWELGHESAGEFLDEIPYIISEMAKEMGWNKYH
jgi:hypothetical protein